MTKPILFKPIKTKTSQLDTKEQAVKFLKDVALSIKDGTIKQKADLK